MKKTLYIIKKIIRKLYHLIWFLSLVLFFIPCVSAKTTINWAGEVSHTIDGWFSNCNTSSSCSTSGITQNSFLGFNDTSQSVVFPGLMSRLTSYNDNIGVQLGFSVNSVLKTDTLYSVRVYLCSGSVMHPLTWTTGNNDSDISNHTYYADTRTSYFNNSANPQPFEYYTITGSNSVGSPSFSSCRIHSVIFRPTINSTFVGLQFNTDSSYTGNFWFIGYDLDVIGSANSISNSDLNNAINNSGLATASSVTQVQQSITQVQQELSGVQQEQQQTNQKLDDIDDTLNDETAPSVDLSDIETSDTPISDLVTLPLTLLNSIYNGISGACSNWTLLLPFNHSILLECFTISDYVGSNVAVTIDTAICLFMAYRIILLFIAVFNDITTLSDTYTNYVKRGRF